MAKDAADMLDKRIDEIREDTRETRSMLEKMRDYEAEQDRQMVKDRERLMKHERDCLEGRGEVAAALKSIQSDVKQNTTDLQEHRKTEKWHWILLGATLLCGLTLAGIINWDQVGRISSQIPG